MVSFHLVRYPRRRAARYMAFDRPVLRATAGLGFWRLLGTGRGASAAPGADPRRWALLAVWRDEADLDAFLDASPIARRWRREADEAWHGRFAPLSARGTWGGVDPFAGASGAGTAAGPLAVLTRAAIRPSRLAEFHRAVPAVDRALAAADGRLASVGVGEWPLVRQATFSLWRDAAAVTAFAHRGEAHRRVIGAVRERGWYGEELFARLAPLGSAGAWDGADPLAGSGLSHPRPR
ncbi:spheroidene monooxygenase [Actinomadura sp. PM05-2]|uniref:Spheroidene monooxygenase n=1 Tax=Actinomadura parmotrematis TaxID=2864039 RepID=A0ABS7FYW1_9ACTN|nr:spheroidene monooxygenase [Actinomadura parmotrematis]